MRLHDWFLRPDERLNHATAIDSRHLLAAAWTEANLVEPLADGAFYFRHLAAGLSALREGDLVRFTDWRGDGDELLEDAGPEIATALADACRRGADVRGLLWRSHSDLVSFSGPENNRLAREVNEAGGEVLLDERVRRGGSHHQKLVILRHPGAEADDVAFVGGIDLCHGRRDDHHHLGDPQVIHISKRYGPRPPWHDVQLAVRGPAVGDLDFTFRERWDDPAPLGHISRLRPGSARVRPRRARALGPALADPPPAGTHNVQVLRTYPCRTPGYPFAPHGERSIAAAYAKALRRARSLIYLEDQYLWSADFVGLLAGALAGNPNLHLIAVVPRYPDKTGRVSGPPNVLAQERAMNVVKAAGGDRVAFYDLENDDGCPVYVHAKLSVIDDVWALVGSSNLNRRSWTHDSELGCAVIDSELDDRAPLDPGGLGDGARRFARGLRLSLWAEHLGESAAADPQVLDTAAGFAAWREIANAVERWHAGNREGPRPPGRIRLHGEPSMNPASKLWADPLYRLLYDPDGRSLRLRLAHRF